MSVSVVKINLILKSLHTDDVNFLADETSCISAGDVALSHTDDPGGGIGDPGGGSTNSWGSFRAPSVIAPHHFRFNLFKGICVVCLLFFNDQSLFVVPVG